jgi:hypothetical protein
MAPRFDLVRKLVSECAADTDILVIDDDVRWSRGTPSDLVALAQHADLALAQPSHTFVSYTSHPITVAQPGICVRETTFVEIGPVLFVRADQRELLLADNVAEGMGYGTELAWQALLAAKQLRMGIVDSVRISHLRPIGAGYDIDEHRALSDQRLTDAGFAGWNEAQRTLSRWWWWQATPPWRSAERT